LLVLSSVVVGDDWCETNGIPVLDFKVWSVG
jgi:hypothetical protein